MKILLISGHGAGDSGATGSGYKEADLTRTATSILEKYLKKYDVNVTRYPVARDAYQDNKNGALQYSFKSFNLVIEVHFNDYNGKAYGVETLYRQGNLYTLASRVTSAIASFGFMNRGAKQRTDLMNMNTCSRLGIPYILIETCFIDSKYDMSLYTKNIDAVWDKVAYTIALYYGLKHGNQSESAPISKPVAQKKPSSKSNKIDVDGSWGQATTRLAQKVLGTTVDGIVSNQPLVNRKYLPNCSTYSWEFKQSDYRAGSSMVRALQKKTGAGVDGYFGKQSVKAFQKFLGVEVDGSCGPATVEAWQKWLNSKVR